MIFYAISFIEIIAQFINYKNKGKQELRISIFHEIVPKKTTTVDVNTHVKAGAMR